MRIVAVAIAIAVLAWAGYAAAHIAQAKFERAVATHQRAVA